MFVPLLKDVMSGYNGEVVLYYKQFPLPSHPNSGGAAQAALAAMKQGKFAEMHELLFAKQPMHERSTLNQYAESIGLDMRKFAVDFDVAAPQVKAETAEGNKADVDATPTLFINGRRYEGPFHPKYVKMWIEEELAVNR